VYVLYARDLATTAAVMHNAVDTNAPPLVAGEMGNGHELIMVNTTMFGGAELTNGIFTNGILDAYMQMVIAHNNPTMAGWLREAAGDVLLGDLLERELSAADFVPYLSDPDTSLMAPLTFINDDQVRAGHQLFLRYMVQRFGIDAFFNPFWLGGAGMSGIDAALAEVEALDTVTSDAVDARRLYADFGMAVALNVPFGDLRYQLDVLPSELRARYTPLDSLGDVALANRTVNQFASYSLFLINDRETAANVTVGFEGVAQTPRLPMPADRAMDDAFYWSGDAENANPSMVREIDLSAVTSATLTFDVWHQLENGQNYGYASVSIDGGATWTVLSSTTTTDYNAFGAAYGAGFTGVSNPEPPRPFPFMGAAIQADGVTLGELVPDAPADSAGLQAGDQVIGYDGEEWQTAPNIIRLLSNYEPGDTVNFLVQRGEERLEIAVVVDAHPTRRLAPPALWLEQRADLTPYAGQKVLLRFETVTVYGASGRGLAVDNIVVAETNFGDDGTQADAWEMAGWAQVTNAVAQTFAVQTFVGPTPELDPRVIPIIAAGAAEVTGEGLYRLTPGQFMVVSVSGLNDDTAEVAQFDLQITVEDADAPSA
jgi:PDZ domain/Immune inhibitor A peptidase M6